jgi:hypothetical protein
MSTIICTGEKTVFGAKYAEKGQIPAIGSD